MEMEKKTLNWWLELIRTIIAALAGVLVGTHI